ncbi:hypothetical protein E3V36_04605 [Candidatus Marinimicrobia bacterium MT.SAG.2]|nr:hypothetical protein E3V36_04605 [Candidatus Marinimicrobia bacterium MT.SAG.2]
MYKYKISFSNYKLRDYEMILALREFETLFPHLKNKKINLDNIEVETKNKLNENRLKKLTFFSQFNIENKKLLGQNNYTEQTILEHLNHNEINKLDQNQAPNLVINSSRKTRYLSHSFHEYKGRFYPQLVRSFINSSGIKSKHTVLDPFCGSGTTLVESLLYGVNAIGIDINPAAHMIAKAKVRSLQIPLNQIKKLKKRFNSIDTNTAWQKINVTNIEHLDIKYLINWFPEENLKKIFYLINRIESVDNEDENLLLKVVLSSILRQFSLQDPRQLRIRRRKDIPPINLLQIFKKSLGQRLTTLESFQRLNSFQVESSIDIFLGDVRDIFSTTSIKPNSVDLVITSPPYATALPYIDTDRLSLFVFGFTDKKNFGQLEQSLIGNREITKNKRKLIDIELEKNFKHSDLPDKIIESLKNIYFLNKNADVGFRRKNKAAMLFKYFLHMHEGLQQIYKAMKRRKFAFFVIGNNKTKAGGKDIVIPTANFIELIAKQCKFEIVDKISMSVQPGYLIHSKNSINSEFILVLRKK